MVTKSFNVDKAVSYVCKVEIVNCIFLTSFRLGRVPAEILDIFSHELIALFGKIIDSVKFPK